MLKTRESIGVSGLPIAMLRCLGWNFPPKFENNDNVLGLEGDGEYYTFAIRE